MLKFIIGRAGSGKTYTARRIAVERAVSGKNRVMLIVPEQYSFESERALIEQMDVASSERVEVLSFTRLVNIVHRNCGGISGRLLDDSGRAALMGLALEDVKDSLSLFKKQADLPEFIPELLHLLSEFKQASISESNLHNAYNNIQNNMLKNKLNELNIIFDTYNAYLSRSYLDSEDCLDKLYNRVIDTQYFKDYDIIIDSFQHFTGQQYKIVEEMIKQANDVYITFCTDSINPSEDSIFHCIGKPISRLMRCAKENGVAVASPLKLTDVHRFTSKDMAVLERNLFAMNVDLSLDEEKKSGVKSGLGDVRFDNTQSAQLNLFSHIGENGAYVIDEVSGSENECKDFASCGEDTASENKYNGDVKIRAAENIYRETDYIAQEIRRLVREEDYKYGEIAVIIRGLDDYLNILSSAMKRCKIPYFCDKNIKASSLPLFMAVKSLLRVAVHKYNSDDIFAYLKSGLTEYSISDISTLEQYTLIWGISGSKWLEEWTGSPRGFDNDGSDFSSELEHLNGLRKGIVDDLNKFILSYSSGSAEDICTALYKFLINTGADKRLGELCDDDTAEIYSRSWDALMDILSRIAELFCETNLTPALLLKIFEVMADNTELGEIPQHIDEVTVSEAERVRIDNAKVVFIAGANDGVYPKISAGGILTDDDRINMSALGLDISAPEDDFEEKLLFYSIICQASEKVYITYRLSDLSSEAVKGSEYLEYVKDIFESCLGRAENEFPQSEDDALRMAAEKYNEHTCLSQSLKEYLRQFDTERYLKLEAAVSRQSDKISSEAAQKLFGRHMSLSSSKVETYNKCRFSYFCKYGLNAKPLRKAKIDAMHRGTIIHFALEKMIEEYGASLADMELSEIKSKSRQIIDEYIKTAVGAENLPASLSYMLDNISTLLSHVLLRIGKELSQSKFSPLACELKIGYDAGDIPPLEIALDEGRQISVTGIVDRVDIFKADGQTYIRIVDYKTGKKRFKLSDVLYGLNMQMLVYLFTLCRNGGETIGENVSPAGILYMPVKRTVLSGGRNDSSEEIEREYEKQLKMNGLLSDDLDVLKAMESDMSGRFIPAQAKKDGGLSKRSSVANTEEFKLLESYVFGRLRDMGEHIYNGDVEISPRDGSDSPACAYCDYRSVCRIGAETEIKEAGNMSDDDAKKAMEEVLNSGDYPY